MSRETAVPMKGDQPLSRDELAQQLRMDPTIASLRDLQDRLKATTPGTPEREQAEDAVNAALARLSEALTEDGETCIFLRPQA